MKRAGLLELHATVAVANHRSFRKAAAELGMSPSALSHAVAGLEERMGVRLFHRTTRSVSLSEAGRQFLDRVAPALGQIAEAIDGVNAFRATPSGTLRINAHETSARMVLAPVVLAFLDRYPDMQVDIVTEGKMVDIVEHGFDFGIRQAGLLPLDMIAVPCSTGPRFAVAGTPAYFAAHGTPAHPNDLRAHRCIRTRLPGGGLYPWEFERGTEKIVVQPAGQLTLDNHHLMIDAALRGAGLLWTSVWGLRDALTDGSLVTVLDDWSPPSAPMQLYYPSHRHVSAGMAAFLALLREVGQQQGWSAAGAVETAAARPDR